MKSKLKISAVVAVLLVTFTVSVPAQYGGGAGGMTVSPAPAWPSAAPGTPVQFDPTTGQPIPPVGPDWKDANWKDPDITLTNVNFDGLSIKEIARFVREQFKGQIDVILPTAGSPPGGLNQRTGLPMGPESIDFNESYSVHLQLKNVTASELFNAMNLVFENDTTPLRWELKLIGKRQVAFLHVLIQPMPQVPAPPSQVEGTSRRVYFVGNLIGDEKNGGMTMEQIINTVTDVGKMAGVAGGSIQFHKEAQLLVVSGTQSQIDFVEQTLKALQQKMNNEAAKFPDRPRPKRTAPTDN